MFVLNLVKRPEESVVQWNSSCSLPLLCLVCCHVLVHRTWSHCAACWTSPMPTAAASRVLTAPSVCLLAAALCLHTHRTWWLYVLYSILRSALRRLWRSGRRAESGCATMCSASCSTCQAVSRCRARSRCGRKFASAHRQASTGRSCARRCTRLLSRTF